MVLEKKVCIIGAGVSGLKAAQKLLTAPGTPLRASDVIIIEAQDRIGGRIKTDRTLSKFGHSYDLGASWFHDALTNSVLHRSIADGSFDVENDGYFNDQAIALFSRQYPGKMDFPELKFEQVVKDIEKFIEIHFLESLDVPDVSLEEVVRMYVEKYDKFLSSAQKDVCPRLMRYLELWFGIESKKISAKYAVMSHQGRNLFNKKGFSYLIDTLLSQLECDILTDEQVDKIERDISGKSYNHLVTTTSGTQIGANFLVVTVPQSVLALDASEPQGISWTPLLPQHVSESIKSVHFGALGKVIFEFDRIWWDEKEDSFHVLADLPIKDSCVSNSSRQFDIGQFEYPIFVVNYAKIDPTAHSLVVLIQSPVTDYLERNPHLAWDFLKPMLCKLSTQEVSAPVNTIVTDWTLNPFTRGSYTALYVDDDPTDIIVQLSGEYDACGMGPNSTIRFAGEHTVADGAGCVHGAYDSGERAADWILQFLEK